MARRRQSTAEDLMDLVALLPWWAGLGLAVISYFVLHRLAVPPAIAATVPTPDLITSTMVAGLATAGQFIVPLLCCFGALTSVLRRRRRAELLDRTSGPNGAASIASLSWREFELLVGEAYRRAGYQVSETGGGGADGGVDLVLRRGAEKVLVQCKHWRAGSVGVAVIRELVGVMTVGGATGGTVVTGGAFTAEAQAFAASSKVDLIDGQALAILLQQAREWRRTGMANARSQAAATLTPAFLAGETPTCPACQASMVRRTARKGSNAGQQFWGCSRFPACRGTR